MIPHTKTKNPQLLNAVAMALANPVTYQIPTEQERTSAGIGDAVKVVAAGERFWVEVVARYNGVYVGVICNSLIRTAIHGLSLYDTILFHADNIISVTPPPGEGLPAHLPEPACNLNTKHKTHNNPTQNIQTNDI